MQVSFLVNIFSEIKAMKLIIIILTLFSGVVIGAAVLCTNNVSRGLIRHSQCLLS